MSMIKIILMSLFFFQGVCTASFNTCLRKDTLIGSTESLFKLSDTFKVVCHFVDLRTMAKLSITNKSMQKSLYDVLVSLKIKLNKKDLSFLTTQSQFTSFIAWTRYLPKLRAISLPPPHGMLTLNDALLNSLAFNCNSLQHVTLEKCHNVTPQGIQSFAQSSLAYLKISHCPQMDDATLLIFAQNCDDLQSIHLAYCPQITDAAIFNFIEHCPYLVNICTFYCTGITDIFVERVLYPLSQKDLINDF